MSPNIDQKAASKAQQKTTVFTSSCANNVANVLFNRCLLTLRHKHEEAVLLETLGGTPDPFDRPVFDLTGFDASISNFTTDPTEKWKALAILNSANTVARTYPHGEWERRMKNLAHSLSLKALSIR